MRGQNLRRRGCGVEHRPGPLQAVLGLAEGARPDRSDAAERDSLRRQPLVGVVGAQRQPELSTRGEHAIGLADPVSREVVDHHPKIGFGAVEGRQLLAAGLACGIDSRQHALGRRLLVAGRAVDLSGQEQAAEPARLQRRIEPAGVDIVIFDRITGTEDARPLEPRNRRHQRALRLRRQRSRNAVRIDGGVVDALGLEEDLMALAIGEAEDLVLDRWTIARPSARDRAGIDGGAMRIRPHDAVGLLRRAGDVARKLRRGDRCGQRGEEFGLGIAVLNLETLPVDGRAVEPRRGPGLEPRKGEPGRVETARKRHRGLIAEAPGRGALVAKMNHSAKERAGGQDDRPAAD